MTEGLGFRRALPVEQHALEDLQRRALIDESLKRARAEGASSVWVIANSRALDFYQACGFAMLGAVPTRFRPGIRMRKVLV